MWVRKTFKERQEKGEYHILVKDLQLFDAEYLLKTFRMTVAKFEELLAWVGPSIQKSSRLRGDVPSPAERLCNSTISCTINIICYFTFYMFIAFCSRNCIVHRVLLLWKMHWHHSFYFFDTFSSKKFIYVDTILHVCYHLSIASFTYTK